MPYDIIIGRSEKDRKKFGKKGAIFLGKQYVKMGQTTSLSNKIYMDVATSHVVFICGKRGSGKSYSMGVLAEGMANLPPEVSDNISVIMLDTMGIYWTMKYANKQDSKLLDEWDLKAKPEDIQIYTPFGFYKKFKEEGIPTDFPFSIKPCELCAYDWCLSFNIELSHPIGVLIERVIASLQESNKNYSLKDIRNEIQKDEKTKQDIKDAAENRFISAEKWGLFSTKGTPVHDLVKGGQVTVLDVSCYAFIPGAEGIRALVIGLVSQKLFIDRMVARKKEEFEAVHSSLYYFSEDEKKDEKREPNVWLIIDEAHEFLPRHGKTVASHALITILREGRQPGISLVLASQQPGKIHTDVMTQSDIVLSHRLTANMDIKALEMLMQSYMREGLDKQLNYLPSTSGSGIIFDDINERTYPFKVRPRFTWHGGSSAKIIKPEKKLFDI